MKTTKLPLLILALLAVVAPGLSAQALAPEAMALSPEPGERVPANAVLVAASFIDPGNQIDPQSVTLEINGVNVTPRAEFRGGVLTYVPTEPLVPGPQRVVVRARNVGGGQVSPLTWTFNVTEALAGALTAAQIGSLPAPSTKLRGTVIVEGQSQQVSGVGAPLRRGEDFLPLMWLNAGGIITPGWRYSARMHLSGYESSDAQPVNRFRVDLRGPFVNVSAGDVNPIFQELILQGRRVRGVQGEIWAGPAKISVVSGDSRRAITGFVDPTNPSLVGRYGTFGQRLLAVRPSFGSGGVFQFGLTFLSVRDDTASLPRIRTQPVSAGGSTRSVNPSPKDNVVAGMDVSLRLAGGALLLQYNNAASLLANDISSGALTQAGLDSLMDAAGYDRIDIDPSRFESFFIMNHSMIPIDPRGLTNVAQQARASVRAGSHLLTAEWRSIGGSYYTLGYPALQRDREAVRIQDSFTAVNDALVMSLGLERDKDNLDEDKPATTSQSQLFASANWQPSPDGVALSGTVRLGTRANDLASGQDGALDEQNRTLSVGAGFPLTQLGPYDTRLSLNASTISREDPVNPQSGTNDLYLLGGLHGQTIDGESSASLLLGVNKSELTGFENATTDIWRATANVRERLTPQWIGTFDGSYTAARSPVDAGQFRVDYNRMELLGGAEFEWMVSTVIGFTGGLVSYADNANAGRDTRELIARLRVSRSF